MDMVKVSVRRMVETVMIGGDIVMGGSARRMREGTIGHLRLQETAGGEAQREVSVSTDVERDGLLLSIHGRADLLYFHEGMPVRVEEIKTTTRDPETIEADEFPLHWAQAECYGHILCQRYGLDAMEICLVYARIAYKKGNEKDSLTVDAVSRMTRRRTAEELSKRFAVLTDAYFAILFRKRDWLETRDGSLRAAAFPFTAYRAGQRELAARAYISIRDQTPLLAEAPTGTGKSAAMLFAALKAMGEGHGGRIFYLTARGTTQQAARDALSLMAANSLRVRSITLSARERMCVYPGAACSPEECPRARGHYDRFPAALLEALQTDSHTPDSILSLSEAHELCPFEFSLDLSLECDVIIGDYNYAFDPRAKLRRYFQEKGDYVLLIDEAHNLPDRAREMYSASLEKKSFTNLRREIGRVSRKTALYRSVAQVARKLKETLADGEKRLSGLPDGLLTELKTFMDAAEAVFSFVPPYMGELLDRYFEALSFIQTADIQKAYPEDFAVLAMQPELRLFCAHPAGPLKEVYALCRARVLFSATLRPMGYYGELCGLGGDAARISMPSPFPRENLLTLLCPLPTRYRDRERSAAAVADVIAAMANGRENGNYLAFFPSYEYLSLLKPLIEERLPHAFIAVQTGGMDIASREAFLELFSEKPQGVTLALAMMGGLFGEGIDLPGERLSGAAVVGVGLPRVCLERDIIKARYDSSGDSYYDGQEGFSYAYVYPGLTRVVQAAGRVVRADSDRGVVLLIDSRFKQESYRRLLPPHWQVRECAATQDAERAIGKFWETSP